MSCLPLREPLRWEIGAQNSLKLRDLLVFLDPNHQVDEVQIW